jgi:alkylresorcinol/alkylpyrone synthase
MSAEILSIATAVPEHRLDAAVALEELRRFWPRLERLAEAEAALGTRYVCEPVDRLLRPRGLDELRASYLNHALDLATAAGRKALAGAGISGRDVDLVITVSCTGYLVPSLDVHLAPVLGLRPDVTRLPITELGCSGGAAALSFGARHLRAFPEHTVLVIAVELPSLSFKPADGSPDNLTASLVFGDGAGAAVLGGTQRSGSGLRVTRTESHLVPGTADLLGFDLGEGGFRVVLDRRLPRVLERELAPVLERFLSRDDQPAPAFFAAHAAGPRIFDAIETALGLPSDALGVSREVFMEVGNTSSAAIFFTLEKLVSSLGPAAMEGLGLGFGPGISVELMQLAWSPSEDARDEASAVSEVAAVSARGV